MKTTIVEQTPEPAAKWVFPCLITHPDTKDRIVVLATDERSGVVIHSDDHPWPVGKTFELMCNTWAGCDWVPDTKRRQITFTP